MLRSIGWGGSAGGSGSGDGTGSLVTTVSNISTSTVQIEESGVPKRITMENFASIGLDVSAIPASVTSLADANKLLIVQDGVGEGLITLAALKTYLGAVGGSTSTAPGAPGIGVAAAGDGYVDVAFTAPASDGGSAILDYTASLSTGQTATGSTSPIRVTAPNDIAVTASVTARNAIGSSPASAASNSVTPAAAALTLAEQYTLTAGSQVIPATATFSGGTAPNQYWGVNFNMYIKDGSDNYPAMGAVTFFWLRSTTGAAPTSLPALMQHTGTAWPTEVKYTTNGGSTGNVPNSVKASSVNTTTFPGLANPVNSLFGGGVAGDYYLIVGYTDGSWEPWPNKVAVS